MKREENQRSGSTDEPTIIEFNSDTGITVRAEIVDNLTYEGRTFLLLMTVETSNLTAMELVILEDDCDIREIEEDRTYKEVVSKFGENLSIAIAKEVRG